MSERPEFTIKQAAEACQVSPKTIRRRLDSDKFPNAHRLDDSTGSPWLIPVTDLIASGLTPGKPAAPANADQDEAANADDMIELGELRAHRDAAQEQAARITAERDRARSDHEQERLRADAAERATLEQRARADVATARAEERDRMIAGSDLERDRLMAELDQVRAEAAEARDNARWSYRRRLRKPIE
jgi:hypothetical protein